MVEERMGTAEGANEGERWCHGALLCPPMALSPTPIDGNGHITRGCEIYRPALAG